MLTDFIIWNIVKFVYVWQKCWGRCDNLITKFESDNPKFDMERAATEVDQFMIDCEMLSKYIAFEKS